MDIKNRLGIAQIPMLLGLGLMVVVLPAVIVLSGKSQDNRNRAAVADSTPVGCTCVNGRFTGGSCPVAGASCGVTDTGSKSCSGLKSDECAYTPGCNWSNNQCTGRYVEPTAKPTIVLGGRCHGNQDCKPGETCRADNVCIGSVGDSCVLNFDCGRDSVCANGKCALTSTLVVKNCSETTKPTSSCIPDPKTGIKYGWSCDTTTGNWICKTTTPVLTVTPIVTVKVPGFCITDENCGAGYHCTGAKCFKNFGVNAACTFDSDCESNACVGNYPNRKCAASETGRLFGASCLMDSVCASKKCVNGKCAASEMNQPNGASCSSNLVCTSLNCVNGRCAAPQPKTCTSVSNSTECAYIPGCKWENNTCTGGVIPTSASNCSGQPVNSKKCSGKYLMTCTKLSNGSAYWQSKYCTGGCDSSSKTCLTATPTPIGGCFLPGTLVQTIDGQKKIEEITVGESVRSFDESRVNESKVTEVYKVTRDYYYRLVAGNSQVKVTAEHPFYRGNGEFTETKDLRIGDKVIVLENGEMKEVWISILQRVEEKTEAYNMTVDVDHTYFANGFAVHNKTPLAPALGGLPTTPDEACRKGTNGTEVSSVGFGLLSNVLDKCPSGQVKFIAAFSNPQTSATATCCGSIAAVNSRGEEYCKSMTVTDNKGNAVPGAVATCSNSCPAGSSNYVVMAGDEQIKTPVVADCDHASLSFGKPKKESGYTCCQKH